MTEASVPAPPPGPTTGHGRPRADYQTGPVTKALRWISLGATLIMSAVLLVSYPRLPEIIPVHFNFAGTADGWGPRGSILVLVAVFVVLQGAVAWLSFIPHVFNYPLEVTESNAQALYREGERMIVWVGAAMALGYVGMGLGSLGVFDTGPVITVAMIGMFGAAVAGIVLTVRAGR